MTAGSLITMLIILGIAWGGVIYFISIASKNTER